MTKPSLIPSGKILIAIVGLLIIIGVGMHFRSNNRTVSTTPQYPEYLNIGGSYVFSVPKSYNVDDQAIPGAQLIYTGSPAAKTLEDVYNANGISVQANSDQTDHSAKAFKDFVNNTFVPKAKTDLATTDIKVTFGKINGVDNAKVTANKDGKVLRFIYLQNGQHPVVAIAKSETDPLKKIEDTIKDVENSDLKDQVATIKSTLTTGAQFMKDQNAHDLYANAASQLKSKTTEADLAAALKTAATYTGGTITVSGVSYTTGEFSSSMSFTPSDKNVQKAFGAVTYKNVNGQWQLELISLPKAK